MWAEEKFRQPDVYKRQGDTVVVLEAMKMQNNIDAETSGTITSINVNKGDAVMEGDTPVSYTHLDVYKRQVLFFCGA